MLTNAHLDRFVIAFSGMAIAYAVYVLSKRTLRKHDAYDAFVCTVVMLVCVLSTYRVLAWWRWIETTCLDPSSTAEYTVHDRECLVRAIECGYEYGGVWNDDIKACMRTRKSSLPRVINPSIHSRDVRFYTPLDAVYVVYCVSKGGVWDKEAGMCVDVSRDVDKMDVDSMRVWFDGATDGIDDGSRVHSDADDDECVFTDQDPVTCVASNDDVPEYDYVCVESESTRYAGYGKPTEEYERDVVHNSSDDGRRER